MSKSKSLKQRKEDRAEDLYCIVNDLRHAVFVNHGQPDEIMDIATRALRIVRQIDNPIIKDQAL